MIYYVFPEIVFFEEEETFSNTRFCTGLPLKFSAEIWKNSWCSLLLNYVFIDSIRYGFQNLYKESGCFRTSEMPTLRKRAIELREFV